MLDRNVENLSGGELQRFAIAVVAAQKADVYMIDEPSSYLDVRQRLKAAKVCGGSGRGVGWGAALAQMPLLTGPVPISPAATLVGQVYRTSCAPAHGLLGGLSDTGKP